MSGIINIILKKDKLAGFHGNTSITVGTGDNYNGSLGINYRNEKFNVFSNYSFRYNDQFSNGSSTRTSQLGDSISILEQMNSGSRVNQSHSIRLGADFYVNDSSTISLFGNFNNRPSNNMDTIFNA
jgi:hypothetical protein